MTKYLERPNARCNYDWPNNAADVDSFEVKQLNKSFRGCFVSNLLPGYLTSAPYRWPKIAPIRGIHSTLSILEKPLHKTNFLAASLFAHTLMHKLKWSSNTAGIQACKQVLLHLFSHSPFRNHMYHSIMPLPLQLHRSLQSVCVGMQARLVCPLAPEISASCSQTIPALSCPVCLSGEIGPI